MTKRVINKVFGGPKHGTKVKFPLHEHVMCLVEMPIPFRGSTYAAKTPEFRVHRYRKRKAILGDNVLDYWAIESASDKEAFNMLCNYLLRGSEIIE